MFSPQRDQEEQKQANKEYDDELQANESQCNINETNESFSERKNHTNVPTLQNNKNVINKSQKSFTDRLLSGEIKVDPRDPHAVAN